MRIFLAGATGVIGVRLVPLLVQAGHEVAGMTRSEAKADGIREAKAVPVVCDVYDVDALTTAVVSFGPDLVLHELTDLPDNVAELANAGDANSRIRTEGTHNLIAAAKAAGAEKFLAQSIAWQLPPEHSGAITEHESAVTEFGGVVLRYGQFYGPGTYFEDELPPHPRVQVDAAAERTLSYLDAPSGVVVIADEESD